MAPHLGAHLCRCTGYVKILDAIDAVAHGTTFEPALAGDDRRLGRQVRGGVADARRPRLHRRHPRARHAARRAAPDRRTPAPTSSAIDVAAALAAPGVEAVFTADDLPGELRVGIIHKDWPVMIPVGGTHVVRRRRAGDRRGRHPSARPGGGRARRRDLRRARTEHRSGRRARRRRAAVGVGDRVERAVDERLHARRRLRRRVRGERVHGARDASARNASSTPSSSPSRRSPCRRGDGDDRRAARLLRRAGRVGRPRRHRPRAGARHRRG